MNGDKSVNDEVVKEKIRRALLSGPSSVTSEATVIEMDAQGKLVVLRQGTNRWVCMPGNENLIGDVPMSLDPMACNGSTTLEQRNRNRRMPLRG